MDLSTDVGMAFLVPHMFWGCQYSLLSYLASVKIWKISFLLLRKPHWVTRVVSDSEASFGGCAEAPSPILGTPGTGVLLDGVLGGLANKAKLYCTTWRLWKPPCFLGQFARNKAQQHSFGNNWTETFNLMISMKPTHNRWAWSGQFWYAGCWQLWGTPSYLNSLRDHDSVFSHSGGSFANMIQQCLFFGNHGNPNCLGFMNIG
jgi:hypothetical protein